jgi:hypothetical protein
MLVTAALDTVQHLMVTQLQYPFYSPIEKQVIRNRGSQPGNSFDRSAGVYDGHPQRIVARVEVAIEDLYLVAIQRWSDWKYLPPEIEDQIGTRRLRYGDVRRASWRKGYDG